MSKELRFIWLLVLASALIGCGGGSTNGQMPPTPPSANFVTLQSDLGDYIGAGQPYSYSQANAQITVSAVGGHLTINMRGNQDWTGDFQVPNSLSQLQTGNYNNLQRYPFHVPANGGLSWSGEGRGCNTLTGWFAIDNVTYVSGVLTAIDLRFEQHCESNAAALHGQIHWTSTDTTAPPGPVNPPPTGLWQPPIGSTPAVGSYVYLQSDYGDYIGAGQTYTYTQADAQITVSAAGGHLSLGISGDQDWHSDFQAMSGISQLQPGYYGNLQRYPFHNPTKGGMDWSGEGRGCNTLTGWFAIDNVTYINGVLTAIDLRFEQRCESNAVALHGQIHWTSNDATAPPGPVNPVPAGLWQPPTGSTPATGNYVYLQSDYGDYIGAGQTYLYTQTNAQITVSTAGGRLSIITNGNERWTGDFQAMIGLSQLQPGYYGNLQRYPFHNPTKGGLNWSGQGRGCNTLTGWFAIDNVTYVSGVLTAIDLRFEQHCESAPAGLHGQIHWAQ